ncbi:MAG: type II toxin-antitoxin system HicA family toxin [Rectinemataceae bacterium]|jgi:predicted RNA binding protein YcfA (HicA-like mRNA interferase family)
MSHLPRLSGRECIFALQKVSFFVIRQHGSHVVLQKGDPFTQLVIPDHKELDTGTLRAIIRQSGLSIDEFLKLL